MYDFDIALDGTRKIYFNYKLRNTNCIWIERLEKGGSFLLSLMHFGITLKCIIFFWW